MAPLYRCPFEWGTYLEHMIILGNEEQFGLQSFLFHVIMRKLGNGLVIKALDSQYRFPCSKPLCGSKVDSSLSFSRGW